MKKLEDSVLWKNSYAIGKILKDCVDILPEDEKYPMGYKLNQYSFDVSSLIAEALGSIDPRDKVWQCGKARSVLYASKDAYKQVCERDYIKLDPDHMVLIEDTIKLLDEILVGYRKEIPEWFKEMSGDEVKK